MTGQRIRIRLKAFDHRMLDASSAEIVRDRQAHRREGGRPHPAPHPHRALHRQPLAPTWTRKSMDQFEIRTHKRLLDIVEAHRQDR